MTALVLLLACSREVPAPPTRAPEDEPSKPRTTAILLARHPELRTAGEAAQETETVGGIRRTGLAIAPGAHVTYTVTIPEGSVLGFEVGTIGAATGKSQVDVTVTRAGTTSTVDQIPLLPRLEGLPREVALGAAGPVEIDLTNVGTLTAFLTEPAIYVPRIDRRVVLVVLADTLRRDHLGVYGGAPTPAIDALAERATIFDDAYTVAPWTLPAARTILSGRWPDEWDPAEHLGTTMADGGWFTALLAGSPYLGADFGMDRGWSWHVSTDGSAATQVERLKELLSVEPDRDLFVVLHVMDAHAPYGDTASNPPAGIALPLVRSQVVTALAKMDATHKKAATDWLAAQYEAAVVGMDRAIAPVLASLGHDDIAVIVADHGEELGDHGGWEHGHALTEELVHVPLIIKADGMQTGHRTDPVSLVDLAPTIETLAGIDTKDTGFCAPDAARLMAFGWLLYGDAEWGVLDAGHKRVVRGAAVSEIDLATDASETSPHVLTDLASFQTELAKGIEHPVIWTWRVKAPLPLAARTTLAIDRSTPFESAWPGPGPATARPPAVDLQGTRFQTSWPAKAVWPREIFLAPGGAEPHVAVTVNGKSSVLSAGEPPGDIGEVQGIHLDHALAPQLKATAPGASSAELRALGYVE